MELLMIRETRVWLIALAAVVVAALAVWAIVGGASGAAAQDEDVLLYLPLGWNEVSRGDLEPPGPVPVPTRSTSQTPATQPATVTPEATVSPTPSATGTVLVPPSITPLATDTPTPTQVADPSKIEGKITVDGDPLPEGYGLPFFPQIELRHCAGFAEHECVGDEWLVVDRAVSQAGGHFEFDNPAPLDEGDAYQVWWRNDLDGEFQGTDLFLHRWWSLPVLKVDAGDTVDVGVFEVADLKLREICHDCSQSLPIVFKWDARSNRSEVYYWSLFRGCGDVTKRHTAYRTRSLGHAAKYEMVQPPPGFRLNEKYCWYPFIDDGENGTGWPFHDWRVTFLPMP
jgi:hypothetical protein